MSGDSTRCWNATERSGPDFVTVHGVQVRAGSRVRLTPDPGGDVMDRGLAGQIAVVEGIDHDEQGQAFVTVALEDDPGGDLGLHRAPAHRFFLRVQEIEPVRPPCRILVAGIGNIFWGDDGFGCEVARRFARHDHPPGVTVKDFGIGGLDLAYEMANYDVLIMIDAISRGGKPGTLHVIDGGKSAEPPAATNTHIMDPVKVLALARAVGSLPSRVLVVGCEAADLPDPDSNVVVGELSASLRTAIEPAIELLTSLLSQYAQATPAVASPKTPQPNTPKSSVNRMRSPEER